MPWCTYVFDEGALRFGCVVGLPAMLRCSRVLMCGYVFDSPQMAFALSAGV